MDANDENVHFHSEILTADTELSDERFLDECAMRAMQPLILHAADDDGPWQFDGVARAAYRFADAMLAERQRRKERQP